MRRRLNSYHGNKFILGGLALLWFIESNHHISICFPLMVAAIVGIRKAMDYFPNIFTQRELSWLDDVIPDEQKERFNLNCSNNPWIHGRWAMVSLQQT